MFSLKLYCLNTINDELDDLIGLDDIKDELMQIKHMYENRETYRAYNVDKPFNIFMTGPAGVGKTKIARCLAKSLNIPLIYGSAAGLQSGYVGGGTRALKAMAKRASKHKRAIIFLDEGESLFRNRMDGSMRSYESETINSFLSILDGVNTTDADIIWMVASNMDEVKVSMDPAMLRRFPLKINFRLPNFEVRKEIIDHLVSKISPEVVSNDINSTKLAAVTTGFSPAQLETMIQRAALDAIRANTQVNQFGFLRAFERVAIGLTDRDTTGQMDDKRFIVACHEVGHFLMNVHSALTKTDGDFYKVKDHIDVIKISTEAVSKLGALGFVLSREKEVKLETLNDYEDQIMHLYGGMANEEVYSGKTGTTAGAHNDLQKVSQLLKVLVVELGFYQNAKVNYTVINKGGDIPEFQLQLIQNKSIELYSATLGALTQLKPLSDILVNRLMVNYVLDIDEALNVVEEYFYPDRSEVLEHEAI